MKKALLISISILFFVFMYMSDIGSKTAYADTHTHTDACYVGHRHTNSCTATAAGVRPVDANTLVNITFDKSYSENGMYSSHVVSLIVTGADPYKYGEIAQVFMYIAPQSPNSQDIITSDTRLTGWYTSGYNFLKYSSRGYDTTPNNRYYYYNNEVWKSVYNAFLNNFTKTSQSIGYKTGKEDLNNEYYRYTNVYWNGNFPALVNGVLTTVNYFYSCGLTQDTTPVCPAYLVPPTVSLYNMSSNTVLSEANTSFCPQIRVFDNENDNLTCYYYLDGSPTAAGTLVVNGSNPAKVAAFTTPFSTVGLAEGPHTIRVTATDNYAKYIGETTLTYRVDKSAPIINSVNVSNFNSSIKLTASATDTISGLAANAYRFTIGGTPTDWLTTSSYTKTGLTPNTTYNYSVEVRDASGHVSTTGGSTYTKVDTPGTTATALAGSGIQLVVKDANPASTQYSVQVKNVENQYATSTGVLSSSASWFTLPYDSTLGGRKLILSGLTTSTSYTITVASKNSTSGEIAVGTPVAALTAPGTPNLTASNVTYSSIRLDWSDVPGAQRYEINRSTVTSDGTVTGTETIPGIIANYYIDTKVDANQRYHYVIRCKNQSIYGIWSTIPLSVKTLPMPPAMVTGVSANTDGSSIDITWDSISGILGYEVEVIYDGKVWRDRVATNEISFDTGYLNCQYSIKVKAFNVSNGSDPSDDTLWSNEGEWSNEYICYTDVNIPILDTINEGQYTNNSATITWDTNNNPDSVKYKLGIYKSGIVDKEINVTGVSAGNNKLSYHITGLSPETNYSFKLKAVNMIQTEGDWSNEVNIMTLIDEPGVITGLRATAKSDNINLFWNPSERAYSYDVERNGTIIASGITTISYVDSDVNSDTEYTYKIMALNTTGNSGWSSTLAKKTLGNIPVNPTVTSVTGSSISCTLEWTTVETATGYDVEVGGKIYNVGMNTTYDDNGLIPGSYYTYRVRTRNIYGKSSWSEVVTYYTMPIAPNTPSNVSASASGNTIQIIWGGVTGAVTYDVEVDGVMYSNIQACEYLHTSGETLSDAGHTVRVRAVNEGGLSEWSTYQTVTISTEGSIPILPIPTTPSFLGNVSGSAITYIPWSKVDNATQYQLEDDGSIIYTGTEISYFHTSLLEGSQHEYRVRAGNSSGFSDWSNSINVTVGSFRSATPGNISYYRIGENSTAIIWDKVADVGRYQIEINGVMLDEFFYDTIAEIATIPGIQYMIRIASVIQTGEDIQLEWSDEVEFRSSGSLPESVNIGKVTAASDAITLTWTEVPDSFGYEIEINKQIIKIGKAQSYTITSLNVATSYSIRMRAYNASGTGDWCKDVTIMTHEGAPGVPINIRAESTSISAATGCAISLSWDSVEGATSYEVKVSNGKIYTTGTNEIAIGNLIPGEGYNVQVRALTDTEEGAWSTNILFVPKLIKPDNITVELADGVVHILWDTISGADNYEVEIDGIIYAKSVNPTADINSALFNVQRMIRVRACYETQRSDWSEAVVFFYPLPVSVDVTEGETFSITLPYKNAIIDNYMITISYNNAELALLDACELTPMAELSTTYIEDLNTHVIINQQSGTGNISFIVENGKENVSEGIASSIKFRSLTTDTITIRYSVTAR